MMEPKIIFICDNVSNNINSTRFNRAKLIVENFESAIIYKDTLPEEIKIKAEYSFQVKGKIVAIPIILYYVVYLKFREKYNIIWTQPKFRSGVIGLLGKLCCQMTWIFDLWDLPSLSYIWDRGMGGFLKKTITDLYFKFGTPMADVWIVAMQSMVLKIMPPPSHKTKIVKVTNGISIDFVQKFLSDNYGLHFKQRKGLTLCYSGWITFDRGLKKIFELLPNNNSNIPKISISLFGPIEKNALHEISNYNKIKYLGILSHKEALCVVAKSDICLCILDQNIQNYLFAYPIKIFEYMALGKIVVATKTYATSEIIKEGENGFFVSDEPYALKTLIYNILNKTDDEINIIKLNAINTANNFGWEVINNKILHEIQSGLTRYKYK